MHTYDAYIHVYVCMYVCMFIHMSWCVCVRVYIEREKAIERRPLDHTTKLEDNRICDLIAAEIQVTLRWSSDAHCPSTPACLSVPEPRHLWNYHYHWDPGAPALQEAFLHLILSFHNCTVRVWWYATCYQRAVWQRTVAFQRLCHYWSRPRTFCSSVDRQTHLTH